MMNKATIDISSLEEVGQRVIAAVKSGKPHGTFFSYATPELLFRTFTTPRWHIIRAMTGAGPMSIRELSRRLVRDIKGVHRDVQALIQAGLIEKDENGAIVFPFDTVHVNFTLKAADLARPAEERRALDARTDDVPAPGPRRRAAPRKKSAPRPAGKG